MGECGGEYPREEDMCPVLMLLGCWVVFGVSGLMGEDVGHQEGMMSCRCIHVWLYALLSHTWLFAGVGRASARHSPLLFPLLSVSFALWAHYTVSSGMVVDFDACMDGKTQGWAVGSPRRLPKA